MNTNPRCPVCGRPSHKAGVIGKDGYMRYRCVDRHPRRQFAAFNGVPIVKVPLTQKERDQLRPKKPKKQRKQKNNANPN